MKLKEETTSREVGNEMNRGHGLIAPQPCHSTLAKALSILDEFVASFGSIRQWIIASKSSHFMQLTLNCPFSKVIKINTKNLFPANPILRAKNNIEVLYNALRTMQKTSNRY